MLISYVKLDHMLYLINYGSAAKLSIIFNLIIIESVDSISRDGPDMPYM